MTHLCWFGRISEDDGDLRCRSSWQEDLAGRLRLDPEQIDAAIRRHAGDDARVGIETGPMTPGLCTSCGVAGSMSHVLMRGMRALR